MFNLLWSFFRVYFYQWHFLFSKTSNLTFVQEIHIGIVCALLSERQCEKLPFAMKNVHIRRKKEWFGRLNPKRWISAGKFFLSVMIQPNIAKRFTKTSQQMSIAWPKWIHLTNSFKWNANQGKYEIAVAAAQVIWNVWFFSWYPPIWCAYQWSKWMPL